MHPRAAAAARLAEVARRSLLEYKRHTSKAVMGTTRKHQHHWTQFPKTTSGQLMIPRAAIAMGNNMRNQGKAWSIRGSAEPNQLELILDDLGPARFVLASVASITSNRQRIKNMQWKAKQRMTNETDNGTTKNKTKHGNARCCKNKDGKPMTNDNNWKKNVRCGKNKD